MNVKFLNVSLKGLKEILRDKRGFALLLALPILIMVMFSFAFGSGSFLEGGSIPHQVVVINNDVGAMVSGKNNTTQFVNYGKKFTEALRNATAENSSTKLFNFNDVNQNKANDLLNSRSIDALIIIPKNFSSALGSMVNNSTRAAILSSVGQQTLDNAANATALAAVNAFATPTPTPSVTLPKAGNVSSMLTIEGDTGYANFAATQGMVSQLFNLFKTNVKASAVAAVKNPATRALYNDSVPLQIQSIAGTQSFSTFDYSVPGLIVFALLLQVSVVAAVLVRDVEMGTLDRLKLSKVRSFDLLFGTFVTWSLVTVAQVLILIAVAIALGYKHEGDFSSLGLAIVIGVIAGMASISLALIVASFTKNEQQATILSAMIAVPLSFLAGAFMPLPRQVLGEFGGRQYMLYDALPWTHAISALRSVLTYGTGLSADVAFDMSWLIFLTAILFIIGVVIYSLMRLRPEE